MDIKDKLHEEVLICGTDSPDGSSEPLVVLGPEPLYEALGQYALCNGQMKYSGCTYVFIVDLEGNILLDKWIGQY